MTMCHSFRKIHDATEGFLWERAHPRFPFGPISVESGPNGEIEGLEGFERVHGFGFGRGFVHSFRIKI